jgi:hypothetical protein
MMPLPLLPPRRCRPCSRTSMLASVASAAVLIGLLLAGCGTSAASASAGGAASEPTATPTPATPTPATPPPPAPTPPPAPQACDPPAPAVLVGGLQVGTQADFGNLAYPRVHLPEGTPLKPLHVPNAFPNLPSDAPTNPGLGPSGVGGGYVLVACNASAQRHQIHGVVVRLEHLIPYTGQLNEWSTCAGAYSRVDGPAGGGCGGGPGQDEFVQGAFAPSAPVGTVIATTQYPGIQTRYGTLPWTLQPGDGILIDVEFVPPTAPGYYTFALGFAVDAAAPVFAALGPVALLAPVAHEWSGTACTAPAMQSQIPPAVQPPTYYLCPATA